MKNKNFSILYVDDEEHNLNSFKANFRKYYTIRTAISGKEGLDIMRNNEIDLIITDQRMPGMTGIQFLEKIIPEFPDTISMILTGFSDIDVIIEAINTGRVFRYITKPWDADELKMTIDNAMQLHSLQVKNRTLMETLHQKVIEQEKTLKLFIKYVPEPVVKKALSNQNESIFDGELRKVAVIFCDIRGFTPISEESQPKDVVSFLNDYYSLYTKIIKQHNGTVNQFIGDEIFAIFGAPVAYPNNEENAVFSAIEMIESLQKLNDKYSPIFNKEIVIGIGINYGEVIAGNLGSEDQISYSVTGDTVNTGKRIETLTKETPNSILISDSIYQKTKDFINVKAWDPIAVKGKKEKMVVYEVLGLK